MSETFVANLETLVANSLPFDCHPSEWQLLITEHAGKSVLAVK